ncbi:protein draper-like [Gigantopelta aegis]|uniref:protein draper-like n=1 Tax=Gigantopelta aegis TaxID=1735272 RepID=UPI001B88B785|nr:protein draper-like [Gigantopelta aegis]
MSGRWAYLGLILVALWICLKPDSVSGACPPGNYGVECGYTCHCNLSRCDEVTGCIGNTCNRPWFGPRCRTENVAMFKTAYLNSYSTGILTNSSQLAVDGNNKTDMSNQCIPTDRDNFTWWKVDFGRNVFVHKLAIFYRADYCDYVHYGVNCKSICAQRHCKGDQFCDFKFGNCKDGCLLGWKGRNCNESCDPDHYGYGCSKQCSKRHCDETVGISSCDATGSCDRGCIPGWTGTDCLEKCSYGQYGQGCRKLCANRMCQDSSGSSCHHVTGKCIGGCSPGYQTVDCTELCNVGLYGRDCALDCNKRQCKNRTASCNHVDGSCGGECQDDYIGIDCTGCDGKYGPGCSSSCSVRHCRVAGAPCDHVTGSCDGPCDAGWQGETCTDKCDTGKYGEECAKACAARHCSNRDVCPLEDGECVGGCISGFQGLDCLQDISSKRDSTKDTDYIIAALAVAAGLFCILFITVTCILLWYVRRHRTKSASCKQNTTSTNNGPSNQVIDTTDVEYDVVDEQNGDRSSPRSQHENTTHHAIHVNSSTSRDGIESHPRGYDSGSGYVNADQSNEYLDLLDLPQNQYEKITGVDKHE